MGVLDGPPMGLRWDSALLGNSVGDAAGLATRSVPFDVAIILRNDML